MPFLSMRIVQRIEVAQARDGGQVCVFARCAALALQNTSGHERQRHSHDAAFLLLFNAHHEPLDFTLPPASFGESWSTVLDTTTEAGEREGRLAAGSVLAVKGRSVIVLSPL